MNALEWENLYYSEKKGWQYTSSEYMKGTKARRCHVWYCYDLKEGCDSSTLFLCFMIVHPRVNSRSCSEMKLI